MPTCQRFSPEQLDWLAQARTGREEAIAEHQRMLRICWPEWPGPEVGGRAEVYPCVAYPVIGTAKAFFYMAPVILTGRTDGGFVGRVDYPDTAPSQCRLLNGCCLALDILQIWAPTQILWAARRADNG